MRFEVSVMKVALDGRYRILERNIRLEGDEVVPRTAGPDVLLGWPSEYVFPRAIVESMGFEPSEGPPDFYAFRWSDSGEWRDQVLVGFPLRTLMDGDLGPPVEAGMACRFVPRESPAGEAFERRELADALQYLDYRGFVTIGLSIEDLELRLKEVRIGWVPYWGFLNALEGVPGRILEWVANPDVRLMESWTVSLLLSRWPYPAKQKSERAFIGIPGREAEKHLWLWNVEGHRKSLYTDGTLVGVATAWSPTLSEACRRAIRTLSNVELEGKQFRLDATRTAGDTWGKAQIALLSGRIEPQGSSPESVERSDVGCLVSRDAAIDYHLDEACLPKSSDDVV